MLRQIVLFLFVAVVAAPASSQSPDAHAAIWTRTDGRVLFVAGSISLPETAGPALFARTSEGPNYGPGLDNAAQYQSADRQIHATVYVYAPNLAHAGLSAYATDTFIRSHPDLAPRPLGTRLVSAGGQEGAAIRIDYANYRGSDASLAAFLKTGRWILKLRVTGPDARRAEVEQTMTALLDGLRFEGAEQARPLEPIDPRPCEARGDRRANLLPSETADAFEEAVIGLVENEEHARERDGEDLLTPRFGSAWCLSRMAQLGDSRLPILRSQMPQEAERDRTVLVVPISDSGRVLEVVDTGRRERFVVFYHQIGRTELRGAYDAVPSDDQIIEIISGRGQSVSPVRATIERSADGNSSITIHEPSRSQAQPPI